ncbi:PREDICTED: uncharacterized protein LOC108795757 [Nanorana parkeri]|uniref:uncharacterized protein LOC108795757 n=1 Tax=Nanorana parkeri TaxID=125878 RepID=UPI0008546DFD|nr:PREDICTED: uncharacterized protein LOC108795757 [Nanorana parkeri]
MDLHQAQRAVVNLLAQVSPGILPRVIQWMRHSSDIEDLLRSNADVLLNCIADDLRSSLPLEAMVGSENQVIDIIQSLQRPTLHVDAFLYDDDTVDALCEEGKMSRNYCMSCGSRKTAPIDFISHSFSVVDLKFLFQQMLPDLSGKTLVDVGSRLGAVLYAGYVYSSARKLEGVEINMEFCHLQEKIIKKYDFADRIQVYHSDICCQPSLLHHADVVVLHNVFEYFLDKEEQIKAWIFIMENLRKTGSLIVTVPSLEESLDKLQMNIQLDKWVEKVKLNPDIYLGSETDEETISQFHLYRVL